MKAGRRKDAANVEDTKIFKKLWDQVEVAEKDGKKRIQASTEMIRRRNSGQKFKHKRSKGKDRLTD